MPLNEEHNYRDVPMTIDGHKLVIGGFGNAQGSFQVLHTDHGVGAVVNLTDDEDHTTELMAAGMDARYYTHGSKVQVDDWWETSSKDAKTIEPSIYDNVYEAIKSAREAGLKVAIHCGSGDGRTGTALSALKLRELLENVYTSNPELIDLKQDKSTHIEVEDFDENHKKISCNVAVTPIVKEAIDYVRKFDNSEPKEAHHVSVETVNDVETLLRYELHLRTLFAKRNLDVNQALEDAINNGNANLVNALINRQAPDLNINAEKEYKGELRGPLYIAALRGHAEVVGVLLNVPLDEDINEALQDVITNENMADDVKIKVVRAFVDSNHSELNINEALKLVIERSNNINVIKSLLESNDPDLDINKAFKTAINYGNEDTIKALMESKHADKLNMGKAMEIVNKKDKNEKIIAILQGTLSHDQKESQTDRASKSSPTDSPSVVIHTQSTETDPPRRGRSPSVLMDEYTKIRNKSLPSKTQDDPSAVSKNEKEQPLQRRNSCT